MQPSRRRTSDTFGAARPSPTAAYLGAAGGDWAVERSNPPARGFTADWIRQYLSGEPSSEKGAWLSDDSADSELASFSQRKQPVEESSIGDWLDLEVESRNEDLKKTPTVVRFVQRKESVRSADLRDRFPIKHTGNKSTDTLRQADFWELSPTQMESPKISKEHSEATMEKALPSPPIAISSSPVETPLESQGIEQRPVVPHRPSVSTAPSYQRPKKKVVWKGKNCIIAVPLDDTRGSRDGVRLLTPSDVEGRLRQWESDGYVTEGFRLSNASPTQKPAEVGGQSCLVYPDPVDVKAERKRDNVRVSIPDRAEWESYVTFLKEEKLRALGVSSGDEEPQSTMSPLSGIMSRTSSQYPLSPPIPPSSAASVHAPRNGHPFSPPFNPSTNASSQVGSVTSPASHAGGLPGNFHRAKQSVAFPGVDRPTASPFGYPQTQATPPIQASRSPQNYFSQRPGRISPAVVGGLQSLGEVLGPVSPFVHEEVSQSPQPVDGMLERMRFQQHELQAQLQHQQFQQHQHQLNPGLMTPPAPSHSVGKEASEDLEIAHPTPRGHHRNVSEALQREIDDAERHLEQSLDSQPEEAEEAESASRPAKNLTNSRWAEPSDKVLHHPQPHARTHSLSQRQLYDESAQPDILEHDALEIETNPSLSGSPRPGQPSMADGSLQSKKETNPSAASTRPGHNVKPSFSKLNVEAKEFRFDAEASFAARNFSFSGNSFEPATAASKSSSSAFNINSPRFESARPPSANLNVAAPAFTPSLGQQSFPTGDFKFTSAAFNVEAPPFNPLNNAPSDRLANVRSVSGASSGAPTKIFGEVDLTNSTKSNRRSKALPIVRPDVNDSTGPDTDQLEDDESGRLAPSQSRSKRARRVGSDGDREPIFANPTPTHDESNVPQSPRHHTPKPSFPSMADKENATPRDTDGESMTLTSPPSAARNGPSLDSNDTSRGEEGLWTPHEFKDRDEAATFNAARPFDSSPGNYLLQKADAEMEENQEVDSAIREAVSPQARATEHASGSPVSPLPAQLHHSKRSSLSALARPFEFTPPKPAYFENYAEGQPVAVRKTSGLSASRFAVPEISSPAESHGSPEPEALHDDAILESQFIQPEKDGAYSSTDESHKAPLEEPSYEEIDAVMRQLNEVDPDLGVERLETPPVESTPVPGSQSIPDQLSTGHQLQPTVNLRSDAPSPSPRRLQDFQAPTRESTDIEIQSPNQPFGLGIHAPIQKLNKKDDAQASDWNDALSSADEGKFQSRTQFFDGHVNNLVGGIVDDRIRPLERSLNTMQNTLSLLASRSTSYRRDRRSQSADVEHSDADDEDDEEQISPYRSKSPYNKIDRQNEKIKASVLEALAVHQAMVGNVPYPDLSKIDEFLAEMKLRAEPTAMRATELKTVVEEVISTHPRLRGNRVQDNNNLTAEKYKLQIDGLESMLRVANERADEEYKARRKVEDDLTETKRDLRYAEEKAAEYRESAEEAENSLQTFNEERLPDLADAQQRADALEEQEDNYKQTIQEISLKNAALETTLEDYRLSSDQWRDEVSELRAQNKNLHGTITSLKTQMEDGVTARQGLRVKFDRLQDDLTMAAENLARDQAAWRKKDHEHIANQDHLRTIHEHEVRARQKLELDFDELEKEHKGAMHWKFEHGQTEKEIARLEELVLRLHDESKLHQDNASRFEREFNDARESSRLEVQRTKTAMEADIEAANNQVNAVRAELEAEIIRLQGTVESVKMGAEEANAKHELLLEAALDAKRNAIEEARHAREAAVQEQCRVHERTLDDLQERHTRALHNATEDKQRLESHLTERLALSDDKVKHHEDKVVHLEEKLEIAKSAARAAAQAAAAKGVTVSSATSSPKAAAGSVPFSRGSGIPEKISPQALRESIMVLQDQLQNREETIEQLEQELSKVDKDAPTKIKDRDTEITWLRELLGVRYDDLQDIISTLSQPKYDRDAVKDAAIRLKANLQMEQQEKERAMAGGQAFPSLASISSLAQSPRALPMAAAAAWGNWRKARDTSSSSALSDIASAGSQTPSKSSGSPQSFFSGMMTPPSTSQRQTPTQSAPPTMMPMSGRRITSEARPLRAYTSQARSMSARQMEKRPLQQEPPTTPPLLREASYDQDAESSSFNGYADDDQSTIDGQEEKGSTDSPFGNQ